MPKYKNTQQFIQPIKFGGTRILVKPGEIISSAKELDLNLFPFLILVKDDEKEDKKLEDVLNKPIQQQPKQVVLTKDEHETVIKEQKAINDDIYKKLNSLKKAIDILNSALSNLENEVYGEDVVVEEGK